LADGLDHVPWAKREAVRAALVAAFGARPVAGLRVLQGGVSGALIWQVDMGERSCVLRLEPERIPFHHRQRGFACMVAAATAGIAPAVHYADPVTGIAIMDFVDGRPLSGHPGGVTGLVQELGRLITQLQRTPVFESLGEPRSDVIASVLAALDVSGLFADGLLNSHKEGLVRIRATSPWNSSSLVSSHNDPNPRNMIFDGDRIWLVDWELASCNDPLFDRKRGSLPTYR
jgi:aminoglycoside phosphotransferase (APT) family kinase protein